MKVFISCDMEGISGVTGVEDVDPKSPAYQRFRKIMTADLNAAIDGAMLAGADEILVNDSHNGMRNILIEELNPKAQLVSGFTKLLCMMEGIDESFDLAMLVGYHAMAGTAAAVMDHTLFGRMIHDVWINGVLSGETAINAGIAGCFDVPVGVVTGDDKVAREAVTLLKNVETAVVKQGIDRYVAKCLPLICSQKLIRTAAKRAVERMREFKPLKYSAPVEFRVRLSSTTEAALASALPIVKREDPRTISVKSDNYLDGFRMFWAVVKLASTGANEVFG